MANKKSQSDHESNFTVGVLVVPSIDIGSILSTLLDNNYIRYFQEQLFK